MQALRAYLTPGLLVQSQPQQQNMSLLYLITDNCFSYLLFLISDGRVAVDCAIATLDVDEDVDVDVDVVAVVLVFSDGFPLVDVVSLVIGTVQVTVCVELFVVSIVIGAFAGVVEEGEIETDTEDCDDTTEIEP